MTCEVKVVLDSKNPYNGIRLTTFQLRYWRAIHGEFMTHRVFSRNASSSRAIPIKKFISQVWNDPAMPVHWGKNQAGMKARSELTPLQIKLCKFIWISASKVACVFAYLLSLVGLHKQIGNRILEPWQYISVIVTATEWDNWFELRNHPDAQPDIQELAKLMYESMEQSEPTLTYYHLPYITDEERQEYGLIDNGIKRLMEISTARCARVSYLTHDGKKPSIENDYKLYNQLVGSRPLHASPTEHQAITVSETNFIKNFRGWEQHRVLVEQEIYNQESKK